jgi:hypothetical protein
MVSHFVSLMVSTVCLYQVDVHAGLKLVFFLCYLHAGVGHISLDRTLFIIKLNTLLLTLYSSLSYVIIIVNNLYHIQCNVHSHSKVSFAYTIMIYLRSAVKSTDGYSYYPHHTSELFREFSTNWCNIFDHFKVRPVWNRYLFIFDS